MLSAFGRSATLLACLLLLTVHHHPRTNSDRYTWEQACVSGYSVITAAPVIAILMAAFIVSEALFIKPSSDTHLTVPKAA